MNQIAKLKASLSMKRSKSDSQVSKLWKRSGAGSEALTTSDDEEEDNDDVFGGPRSTTPTVTINGYEQEQDKGQITSDIKQDWARFKRDAEFCTAAVKRGGMEFKPDRDPDWVTKPNAQLFEDEAFVEARHAYENTASHTIMYSDTNPFRSDNPLLESSQIPVTVPSDSLYSNKEENYESIFCDTNPFRPSLPGDISPMSLKKQKKKAPPRPSLPALGLCPNRSWATFDDQKVSLNSSHEDDQSADVEFSSSQDTPEPQTRRSFDRNIFNGLRQSLRRHSPLGGKKNYKAFDNNDSETGGDDSFAPSFAQRATSEPSSPSLRRRMSSALSHLRKK